MRSSLLPRLSPSSLVSRGLKQSTRQFSALITRSPPQPSTLGHHHSTRPFILTRHLTITAVRRAKMSSTTKQQLQFSAGSDAAALEASLTPLLKANGGRWNLTMEGEALEREFKFKTFAKTWDFMTAVSLQCKLKNHHPEWSNVFNTTFIRWTTHHPKGLSAKDVELAAICDQLAHDFSEVVEEQIQPSQQQTQPSQPQRAGGDQQQQPGGAAACGLAGLADRAVGSAGDCCVPKKQ